MASEIMKGSSIQGRYKVVQVLGKGAFATTYLCEDTADGAHVAIKAMRLTELDAWKSFELFEREAQVLESLTHHGIPRFHDVFREEAGDAPSTFYLVQEHIEGRSLQQLLDSGARLSPPELTQLVLGILDVLDHLHTRSPPLYHRDIKPSNIIIRPMGAPVLIDFGSVCDGWREKDEQGSTVAGTHGYMPPEQYMGKVGATSDLYALGATLLHVITGKHPSSFPFEDGRIEVPDDLPCAPELTRLIDSSLETSTSKRPQSAASARALVLESSTNSTTALVTTTRSSSATALVHHAGDHPDFVDMGPPPRAPDGEHADVYRMLVPQLFSMNLSHNLEAPSSGVNDTSTGGVLLGLMLIACTGGLWLLIAVGMRAHRKSKYHDLFVHGLFTHGEVLGTGSAGTNGNVATNVVYRYEVDGVVHRAGAPIGSQGGKFFVAGDPVGVLYSPDDHARAVIVFR